MATQCKEGGGHGIKTQPRKRQGKADRARENEIYRLVGGFLLFSDTLSLRVVPSVQTGARRLHYLISGVGVQPEHDP